MSEIEGGRRTKPAPASGVLAIVLAVVAVIAGFLILRSISGQDDSVTSLGNSGNGAALDSESSVDEDAQDGEGGDGNASTGSTPAPNATTTTTEPPATYTGAQVIVANANSQGGSAGKASTVLGTTTDFELAEATNATTGDLETSEIQYDASNAAAQPVAETLAKVLPGDISVTEIAGTPPVEAGDMKGAGVVLLLGIDLADLNASQISDPAAAQETSNTAPEVAGSESASEEETSSDG